MRLKNKTLFLSSFIAMQVALLTCSTNYDKFKNLNSQHVADFYISKYGLIFTKLFINGNQANTLIDLGDPNAFQLSTTFVEQFDIAVQKTGDLSSDIQGNKYELFEGFVKKIQFSDLVIEDIKIFSGYKELEYVSKEVKTKIDAVVGWGFLKDYNFKIDYRYKKLIFSTLPIQVNPTSIEIPYHKENSYLMLTVLIDSIKENLIIDTGSPYTVLDRMFYQKHEIVHLEVKIKKYFFFSIPSKRINTSFVDRTIPVDYYLYDLPELSKTNAVGILGGTFFRKYILIVDPEQKKIYLEPYP